ncbi:MAG: DUF2007 domain-containing protein [Candidatus Aminicenantes bacterium]|nr:DUF2007 domain-containing protein [Candidatus Aminicenantes bacterium]
MEQELKQLIVIEGMVEAEIIKSKLDSFDIPCLLQFESAGRLYGITMNGLGKVKIMVNAGDYEKARELLDTDEPEN